MKIKEMPGFMLYREAALILSMLDDESAGRAIKAAALYYRTGEITELEGFAGTAVEIMCEAVDRGSAAYMAKVAGGHKGGMAHWHKEPD